MSSELFNKSLLAQKEFSLNKLEELKDRLNEISELSKVDDICIYVTGSFGRLEATKYSDLDLFFISGGSVNKAPVSQLNKTLIDAELIKLIEKLGFPPFSNDGQFLQIHYIEDIISELGSPKDDFNNFFTARLLLLLESTALYGEDTYNKALVDMLRTYYRDFHKHTNDFLPIFLVNDVIRYWKTLCLNYEHRRNNGSTDHQKKLKTHVKNLKLVFSRKLTCYSFIVQIIANYKNLDEEKLIEIVKMKPIERLTNIANEQPNCAELIKEILSLYSWFIDINNQPEEDLLRYIDIEENRNIAFEKGRIEFGGKIFNLIVKLTEGSPDILKYLVI